ncbi:EboA domain-containing protein [Rudanella lutea]|uniref:EboA domain-containing protein n=1 Tax=Rudanella lutea TaxID=451374 RepID=UPI000370D738|nr:EboA domain-containing protein [Rudanella lutea]
MDMRPVSSLLFALLEQQPDAERALTWLRQQLDLYRNQPTNAVFYRVFTAMPRFMGKAPVVVSDEMATALAEARPGFQLVDWTMDRLARVWWLLQYPSADRQEYRRSITELFRAAEMNELVALYSALPVLEYPEDWRFQATEGVRNNIADVQAAIMLHNPYPAEQLDEAAWNQLVMKAFFIGKDVTQIQGLWARNNPRLQAILHDFAAERRAAGREVPEHLPKLMSERVIE